VSAPRAGRALLQDVAVAFDRLGVRDRDDRLLLCSDHAGRALYSSAQLTAPEAAALLGRLRRLQADGADLRPVIARLRHAQEQKAAELAAASLPPATLDLETGPSRPVKKPDMPPPATGEKVVGWICGSRCEPITEKDMEHARLAGEQLELGMEGAR
jgi:hypothetical protein